MSVRIKAFVFLLLLCIIGEALADLQDEILAGSVEIKFYIIEVEEWGENGNTIKFQDIQASESNTLCSTKPAVCGLTYWNQSFSFTRSDVVISNGYPQPDGKDLKLQYYIIYPDNSNHIATQNNVLSEDTTETILMASKEKVEEAMGTYITYVGEEFYGIPPDSTTNKIMIPVIIILLAIVAITAIVLTVCNTKKENARHKLSIKKKHFSTKDVSSHPTSRTSNGHHGNKELANHHQDKENNLMNTDTLENKYMTEDKNMSHMTHQSFNEFTDQVDIVNEVKPKPNELPPLETTDFQQDEATKKEKRKKKKSKRKHRHREREAYDNSALDDSDDELRRHPITTVQSEETIM